MPNEGNGESPKTPKTVKTTTTSNRKAPGKIRPRREKTVERVYSDYPLKRKNLVKKTTVVNKALPGKDVVKTKTVTNPSKLTSPLTKTVEKEKKVRNFSKGYTKERKVTRENSGMFNPIAGSTRDNKTVSKSFKKENNNNPLFQPKKK